MSKQGHLALAFMASAAAAAAHGESRHAVKNGDVVHARAAVALRARTRPPLRRVYGAGGHRATCWSGTARPSERSGPAAGAADSPLTAVGEADAVKCRDRLARGSRAPCVCYTSPLGRARKTAEILCAGTSIPIVDDDGLVERSFGVLEGLTVAERKAQFPDVKLEVAGRRLRAAGRREPLVDAGARGRGAEARIAERPRASAASSATHNRRARPRRRGAHPYNVIKGSARAALPNTAINLSGGGRWRAGAGRRARRARGERQVPARGRTSRAGLCIRDGRGVRVGVRARWRCQI